jgi:predicted phage tail protein
MSDFTQTSATKINSLSVTVNGQAAAITTNAQAVADINGNLNAMYSIKVGVDVNGVQYAAGMGLGVQNTPSGMQSQVIFLADRFAVMSRLAQPSRCRLLFRTDRLSLTMHFSVMPAFSSGKSPIH